MNKILINTTFLFTLIIAQNTSYKFDYYDISNGLSQNRVQAIYQSSDGYMYVGSQGGINRFDGYDFKYYSHDPSDSTSVPSGWVNAINEDNEGNIWVATLQKSVGYLKPDGSWKQIKLKGMEDFLKTINNWWFGFISDIEILGDNVIISSFGNGVFILNKGKETHYTTNKNEGNIISAIHTVGNKIYLASRDGLLNLDLKTGDLKKTAIKISVVDISKSSNEESFYVSSPDKVFEYSHKKNTYKELRISVKKPETDFGRMVLHNQKLWIVNNTHGLAIYDINSKSTTEILPPVIKDTEHFKMIVDRDNSVWIGTASYGIMKYDSGKQKFNLYSKNFPPKNPLNFDGTWGATIDYDGNYWTGKAESYGEVVKIDRTTGKIKRYLQTGESQPRNWFFIPTKSGLLVNMSGRGWFKYNPKKDDFTAVDRLTVLPDSVGGPVGQTLKGETFAVTRKGIAFYNGTSFVLDKKLNSFFKDKKYPRELSVQKEFAYIWEPDSSKLFKWNLGNNQIELYYQSDLFYQRQYQSMIIYNDSLIFQTTYGFGLVELNTKRNTKRYITVSDGLPSQHLYEGYLDSQNIWISSNYGIFSYNPIDKSVESYEIADGLQDYEFNSNSSYQSKDGELIFAGIRGFNYFYPKDIKPESNPPAIEMQKVTVGEKSINHKNGKVEIPWYDNKIVFDFVALSYRNPSKNQYSYFMEGYEDDWIYSGNRRFATYTNLPAGNYTFKAKGSNNDGIWNDEGASINVKVYPPPWKTWWAYLIYIVSILGMGYSYSKFKERSQLKQMEDERKQSELDAAKDLQESMLPKTTPENKEFSIETFIRSSTEVGGDYYDFFKQEDGSFYSVCGDATGHGTTAGMMVSITKAGLNGIPSLPPNEILNRLNKVVKKVDLGIIRMSLNIVHFKNGTATMANAAMPPIYHYSAKKKKVVEIEIVNLPLGGLLNEEYELAEINFAEGDLLVQLSDGLPEAPNPGGELIDYKRLFDCIEQNAMKSTKDVVESLVTMAEEWLDGNINPDDITIVATKKNTLK